MPIEDRIEQLARFALVILLLVTLGWSAQPRAQDMADSGATLVLVAKPGLRDQFFGSSILIAKPVGDGRHVGFAINRPTDMTLGKLFPEHGPSQRVPGPVYLGGPTNIEFVFALVQSSNSPGGDSLQLAQDLFIAVDAKTVDHIIESDPSHARFFAGLIAWRPGELQEEVKRGLWYVEEPVSSLVMRNPEGLWEELVQRLERRAKAI